MSVLILSLQCQYGRHGWRETLRLWKKVQEKAIKMVAGLQSRDYEDRCRELGLDTLEKPREKQASTKWDLYTGTRSSENETGDRGKKPSAKICQDRSEKVLILNWNSGHMEQAAWMKKSNRQQSRRTSERDLRTQIFEFQRNETRTKTVYVLGTPVNLFWLQTNMWLATDISTNNPRQRWDGEPQLFPMCQPHAYKASSTLQQQLSN